MMSRVKPGYFTDFNAFFTCSSEIDIREFTCGTPNVNRTDFRLAKSSLRFVVLLLVLGRRISVTRTTTSCALLVLAIQIVPKLDSRSRRRKPRIVSANWPAPIFGGDRYVHAFVGLPRRAPINSTDRVTCLPTRKLSLLPWDRRWESSGWIH